MEQISAHTDCESDPERVSDAEAGSIEGPPCKGIEEAVKVLSDINTSLGADDQIICKVQQVQFRKYKEYTAGIFRIELLKQQDELSSTGHAIIAKGIHHHNEKIPHEVRILTDLSIQSSKNPLNPPKLLHVSIYNNIVWIFMEEITRAKLSVNWNDEDVMQAGFVLGRFNGYFSGDNLAGLMWADTGYLKHYLQGGRMHPSPLTETLYLAAKAGYHSASVAVEALDKVVSNYSFYENWLLLQPICLSHNDPTLDNIFLQSSGKPPRAIDWESCTLCPLGFDPVYPLWGSIITGSLSVNEEALMQGYIAGLKDVGFYGYDFVDMVFSFHVVLRALNHKGFRQQWDFVRLEGTPRPALMFGCWWALEATTLFVAKHAKRLVKALKEDRLTA